MLVEGGGLDVTAPTMYNQTVVYPGADRQLFVVSRRGRALLRGLGAGQARQSRLSAAAG
jgi:hypothetical protein